MDKALSSKTIVWLELIADVLVAVVKLLATFFTGGASMAAEGIHSVVDVGSGGLMLYGYQLAARPRQAPSAGPRPRALFLELCGRSPVLHAWRGLFDFRGPTTHDEPGRYSLTHCDLCRAGGGSALRRSLVGARFTSVPLSQRRSRLLAGDEVEQGSPELHRPC
jgi:Cation efflux family